MICVFFFFFVFFFVKLLVCQLCSIAFNVKCMMLSCSSRVAIGRETLCCLSLINLIVVLDVAKLIFSALT